MVGARIAARPRVLRYSSHRCLAAGLYLCIGDPFLPGKDGSAWAIVIIWIGGHVGAFLAELVSAVNHLMTDFLPCCCLSL